MSVLRSSYAARRMWLWCSAAAAGALAGLASPSALISRVLTGWDVAIVVFIALAGLMMARTDLSTLKKKAAEFDGGRVTILIAVVTAVTVCIGAMVFELAGGALKGPGRGWNAAFTIATILLSWVFVHLIFSLHYAHEYYAPDDGVIGGGLEFPGDDDPVYGDFLYFSFIIGCAAQTADVAIRSSDLRRVVTAHCIFSFLFNSAIIALLINITASLLSGN